MLGTPAMPAPKYGPRLRRQEMQDFLMGGFFFFFAVRSLRTAEDSS